MADEVYCPDPSTCTPEHPCFGHKLRFWRENGGVQFSFPYGRDQFHNAPSVREREKQQVADAKRAGIAIERA